MKSSWGCFDRPIFCWNGFCWQKSKHLKQLAWFVRIWMWRESKEIRFAKHQCHSMFRIPIFYIDVFFLVHKRTPHCFSCDLLSPLFWQSVEAVGQSPSSSSQSSSVKVQPVPSSPSARTCLSARTQWNPKVGCFLGIDLLCDNPCLFLPKRETTQDLSALQDIPLVPFGVLRLDWDAFIAFTETFHSQECSDGHCFCSVLPMYFFHLSPFFLGSRDQRHIPG